ncbi:MAG: hypothetical protein RMJ98_05625 [Myxococcales bacterium]|nr:hypothetical protein [Polyangiaceae bacterium]MDW8248771.1 hypothetical protein [Myxococcales bacterium]
MSKPSFRVYFIFYFDGRKTGMLLRTWDAFFDRPLPSAYGTSEEEVFCQLELTLREMEVTGEDHIHRYLWQETFHSQAVTVEIHPLSLVNKPRVIGKKKILLWLTYIYRKLASGAYRVMIPRMGGWFILEDLSLAPEVLRQAVMQLLGENPRWIYDFRSEGEEYVREWEPRFLMRLAEALPPQGGTPEVSVLASVAEDLMEKVARHKLAPPSVTMMTCAPSCL